MFVVGILSYKSINQLEDDNVWVDHTEKVIKTSTNLLQLMIDAETGMRGYGATDNKVFLDPYNEALPKIQTDLSELRTLVQDNPLEVRAIDTLTSLVGSQLDILKTNIDARDSKGLDYMVKNQMFSSGKHIMDNIRMINNHIIDTENALLSRPQSKF